MQVNINITNTNRIQKGSRRKFKDLFKSVSLNVQWFYSNLFDLRHINTDFTMQYNNIVLLTFRRSYSDKFGRITEGEGKCVFYIVD